MKLEAITASKIFQTSKRQKEILSKLNTSGINAILRIQEPEEVHEDNVVHVDDVKEREEAYFKLDTGEDVEVEDVDVYEGVKERDPEPVKNTLPEPKKPETEHKVPYSDRPNLEDLKPSAEPEPVGESTDIEEEQDPVTGESNLPVDAYYIDEGGNVHPITSSDEEPKEQEPVESADSIDNDMFEVGVTAEQKPVQLKIEDIKGYLNNIEETKGLSRVRVKENNELWLYYNDNINLNDVMGDVIDQLLKTNVDLEFNRLARSDNAMVFMLMEYDTSIEQKSENEIDEAVEEAEKK